MNDNRIRIPPATWNAYKAACTAINIKPSTLHHYMVQLMTERLNLDPAFETDRQMYRTEVENWVADGIEMTYGPEELKVLKTMPSYQDLKKLQEDLDSF